MTHYRINTLRKDGTSELQKSEDGEAWKTIMIGERWKIERAQENIEARLAGEARDARRRRLTQAESFLPPSVPAIGDIEKACDAFVGVAFLCMASAAGSAGSIATAAHGCLLWSAALCVLASAGWVRVGVLFGRFGRFGRGGETDQSAPII